VCEPFSTCFCLCVCEFVVLWVCCTGLNKGGQLVTLVLGSCLPVSVLLVCWGVFIYHRLCRVSKSVGTPPVTRSASKYALLAVRSGIAVAIVRRPTGPTTRAPASR
jgi:hypothetical protein